MDLLDNNGNSIGKSLDTNEVQADMTNGGCVIAFQIQRHPLNADNGVRASTNTGLLSNETWKCSGEIQDFWYNENFDDTGWREAQINFLANIQHNNAATSIDGDAKPIFALSTSETHYCRKYICGSKNFFLTPIQ